MREIIVSILLLVGAGFVLIASIGLIRFQDLYSRMHATTKATSFGILLLLLAVAIYFSDWFLTIKAILVILFIYLTAPLAAHSIAKSFEDKKKKKMD